MPGALGLSAGPGARRTLAPSLSPAPRPAPPRPAPAGRLGARAPRRVCEPWAGRLPASGDWLTRWLRIRPEKVWASKSSRLPGWCRALLSLKSWSKNQRHCQSKQEQEHKWRTGQKKPSLPIFYNQLVQSLRSGQGCISPAHSCLQRESIGRTNKSTQPDEQLTMNSEGSMHQKSDELPSEVTYENTELLEQRSRNSQVISPYPDDEMAYCTTEKSNLIEHRSNDLHYECMISCQVTSDLHKEKTIAFLLKELDILRTSNKKLQEKLTEEDKEQKKLMFKLDLQEKTTEAKIAEKTAALVEEVYFAQRERDEAIMSRLQLAIEERDEAIARARHMEMSLKVLENINPEENDMTLQELLNRINNADTGIAIQKNGAIIVDRIYKTKECKKRITAEEMSAVIEERDAALSQCKRLEQELHHLKEQNQTSANNMRHLTAENNQERALKILVTSHSTLCLCSSS
ncbi:mirror-image polydactyly gene 1 protein isoform X4 [Microcebus murinus]|uniref:mirror-image polydactyly gene 1 protein isoform X4 n=1 Tax=Microcebus murinus TaxID=30608 RepID=UPI003F6B4F73